MMKVFGPIIKILSKIVLLLLTYFQHLIDNPERMDAIGLWTATVGVTYLALYKKQLVIIEGLKGDNKLLEGAETLLWMLFWMTPPIVSYSVYFGKELSSNVWLFLALGYAYGFMGKWIFNWILAFRSGASKVTVTDTNTQTTEVTNEPVAAAPKPVA